jgi:hypothetical protein
LRISAFRRVVILAAMVRTLLPVGLVAALVIASVACGDDTAIDAPAGGEGNGADSGSLADAGTSTDGATTTDSSAFDGSAPAPTCPTENAGPGKAPLGALPGTLAFPFPTLRNITVEWPIMGDENANATIDVRYRKVNDPTWRKGLPLRRVPAEKTHEDFAWSNRAAGSIFDVEPDTTYEVEVFLLDPDGGCVIQSGTVKTRPVPVPMPGAPVKPVTPATFTQVANAASPGDILELGAGTYPAFSFPKDGEPGKPIVVRAGGAVTVTGDISLISRKHVHLVGLTVQGRIRLNLTNDVAVMRNTVNAVQDGIAAELRSENDYIADNTVIGTTPWAEDSLGVNGANIGEGILVVGPGHVIEHNKIRGFRDCISFKEGAEAVDQFSIDVIENDAEICADDGIEADFCNHDCRVIRNRFTNTFIAMSSQPGLGGPTYFIRNVAFNTILSTFKLQRGSVGDVLLHNTSVKNGDAFGVYTTDPFFRQYSRNNLFIGGSGGTYGPYSSGTGKVASLDAAGENGDYDYDGFGSTTGAFTGRIGANGFANLVELQTKTTEKHAVMVGLDVFSDTIAYPSSPFPAKPIVSFALKAGAGAVDVGVPLPNINDNFGGAAPDLGAYEAGQAIPAYGPRP